MSQFSDIAAACVSIQRYLELSFRELQPIDGQIVSVIVARPEDLSKTSLASFVQRPAVTILPYRIEVDPTMRASFAAAGGWAGRRKPSLALQLHALLIPWATNADEECRIVGRAMQAMEETPIFAGPLLSGPGWGADETLQLVLQEMDTHELLRIFDSLHIPYRLSVPYLVRILRIAGFAAEGPPVVTSILGLRPSLEDA